MIDANVTEVLDEILTGRSNTSNKTATKVVIPSLVVRKGHAKGHVLPENGTTQKVLSQ
jgi:hypothetical protein